MYSLLNPYIRLLPKHLNSVTHPHAIPQSRECFGVYLGSFLAQCHDLVHQVRRHTNHTIFVTNKNVTGVDPQVTLELKRNVNLRRPRERV